MCRWFREVSVSLWLTNNPSFRQVVSLEDCNPGKAILGFGGTVTHQYLLTWGSETAVVTWLNGNSPHRPTDLSGRSPRSCGIWKDEEVGWRKCVTGGFVTTGFKSPFQPLSPLFPTPHLWIRMCLDFSYFSSLLGAMHVVMLPATMLMNSASDTLSKSPVKLSPYTSCFGHGIFSQQQNSNQDSCSPKISQYPLKCGILEGSE